MREPILLTPGPLTTSLATKAAMLVDWGSWDAKFNALTASVCADLLRIANLGDGYVCVPLQGSGTFAVEAAIGSLVPKDREILVLVNGAYGQRMAKIATVMGRKVSVLAVSDGTPVSAAAVAEALAANPAISHVGMIHCETATGLLNPVAEVAAVVQAAGRALILDSMSAFGALPVDGLPVDAVISSANKCLEGVPGMGFVIVKQSALVQGQSPSLSLDLCDQFEYMQKTGQWRFTPPTHVVAAFRAALDQYWAEGGQPARLARYQANGDALLAGMKKLGLQSFLPADLQAPIIYTFFAPHHPGYDFQRFYQAVRARGFLLYPGKLTEVETFRVGCIGAIDQAEIQQAIAVIAEVLAELGWSD
ncbi:2-aminoethylphosphonate--pyruvate transaminase [Iodobacter fluviatilis]|uniref:2-aminoethylphosphonate--pyruvate transaminase n=1 Tax=Iodobacter fluviatilis TaxID=537 RepID=A0A377QAW5_9NEIS|nr:2-aminoethylphosphonate--pyruvate transaminase [Iodobacter fluviatilis]TCU81748.1 2-aminoethylphosphonate--pyruvate transaminase [Iodobacter fluviatilis]STQ91855.1 2-aminoethylphosphonate--pyruvate transaminase [Iodobacter fluviatilis]